MSMRERYNRDGYVIVRGIFPNIIPPILFDSFNKLYHQNMDKYKSYLSMCARIPSIQQLFFEDEVQDVLKVLGVSMPVPPTYPVMNVMGLPILGGYNGTVAHQDWPSIQGSLDMITVWIPFMNITKENYPIEVIPGSHLNGLREGKINGSVLEIEGDDENFTSLECEIGDVIFMSGFTVHRTGGGVGFRIAASMRFDNAAEPIFNERGFPCAQKRIVDREIKWHPTVEQIRNIYAVG